MYRYIFCICIVKITFEYMNKMQMNKFYWAVLHCTEAPAICLILSPVLYRKSYLLMESQPETCNILKFGTDPDENPNLMNLNVVSRGDC